MLSMNLLNDYFNGKFEQNAPLHILCSIPEKDCPGTCSQKSPSGDDNYICPHICNPILKLYISQKGEAK